jgi:predicted component of type VI protein secretion system
MADISVSRVHAFIQCVDDRFVLFDNNSKFGTLVKLHNGMRIDSQKKAFQIGRTVITFKLKRGTRDEKVVVNTAVTQGTEGTEMEIESDGARNE